MVNLSEYFLSEGYEVTIVTQYVRENEYKISPGIKRVISEIGENEQKGRLHNFFLRLKKLRNIWKDEKPDVILSFMGKNNLMAVLTSRLLGIPIAVSVRAEPKLEYYNRLLKMSARFLFRFADGIILQTEECKAFFSKKVQKKSVILKNSIDETFLCDPYKGVREKRITAVGRIDDNKNHEMIIRAFAALSKDEPDYSLTIYGEGELRQQLLQLVKEIHLENRIFLPGAVADVKQAIYKSAIFVLSSDSEGQPNTLLEAMALGIPCISTDCPCGGPRAIIQSHENGILIPVRDTDKLEQEMRQLIYNQKLAEKLGRNAAKIQQTFSPEQVNLSWKQYLEGLM